MDAKFTLGEPRALISRAAILHNARLIRKSLQPGTRICAILKANAYGHDAGIVLDTLCNFDDNGGDVPLIDAIAVASIDEACEIPETSLPILIFRPVENTFLGRQRSKIELAIRNGWTLTLCSAAAANDVARIALAAGVRANVQVMVDTGMHRSGVSIDEFDHLTHVVATRPSLRLTGVCSHFAISESPHDPITQSQLQRFHDLMHSRPPDRQVIRHLANSAAVFLIPQSHFDMVRPGLALYGIDPTCRPSLDRPLRPAMKWTAPLMGIRELKQGDGVGYGQTWQARRDTRIGLVPVGYADGYLRCFGNRARMILNGHPVNVVGRVSMDLTTIDLGEHPANIGDEVTILDNDPLSPASVYELARLGETIPYEIFCRIGSRIPRIAVDAEESLAALENTSDESPEFI